MYELIKLRKENGDQSPTTNDYSINGNMRNPSLSVFWVYPSLVLSVTSVVVQSACMQRELDISELSSLEPEPLNL
jgi:hypothetical protein